MDYIETGLSQNKEYGAITNLYYKKVIIEEGVTAIEDGAFSGWESLETVEIKSVSLQSIGDGAFCGFKLTHLFCIVLNSVKSLK